MHHRHRLRMRSWDYRANGAYSATLVARERRNVFGEIRDGVMGLNRFGCVVWSEWYLLAQRRSDVLLDDFIVMPNHVHLILFIEREEPLAPSTIDANLLTPGSFGAILGGFKSGVSREIGRMRGERTRVWQRLFQDRVVRDERELNIKRNYIRNNVANWPSDEHFSATSS